MKGSKFVSVEGFLRTKKKEGVLGFTSAVVFRTPLNYLPS
jgi:hypothetical protein